MVANWRCVSQRTMTESSYGRVLLNNVLRRWSKEEIEVQDTSDRSVGKHRQASERVIYRIKRYPDKLACICPFDQLKNYSSFTEIPKCCRKSCCTKTIANVFGRPTPRTALAPSSMARQVQALLSYLQGDAHW